MTQKDYIERLKQVQRMIDSVKEDLDHSIKRMENNMKGESCLAALAGRETMKMLTEEIFEIATTKIEN